MKKIIGLVLAICLAMPVFAVDFEDLAGYDWANDAIEQLAAKGIINGIGGGRFDPEGRVTYEQFAKMVTLAFDLEMTATGEQTYPDVSKDRWSYAYIEASKQLFERTSNFLPEASMTRYAVVKVLALAVTKGNTKGFAYIEFADSEEMTDDMKLWSSIGANLGIVQGFEDNTFKPNENVSRAQAATMLFRAMNASVPTPEITPTPTPTATPMPETTATPTPEITPSPTPTTEINTRMDFFVVTGVSRVMADGEETVQVKGFDKGNEVTFTCERARVSSTLLKTQATDIAVGDVLSAVRDINGAVRDIFILFSVADKYDDKYVINPYADGKVSRATSGSTDFLYGLVRMRNNSSLLMVFDNTIDTKNETNTAMCAIGDQTNVYEYNPDTKKVKLADSADIQQDKTPSDKPYSEMGSFILVRETDYLAKDIYIINNKR